MRRAPVVVGRTRVRRSVRGALARQSMRERMVLALLLVERMRPVEVATTLHMSLVQVERIRTLALARLARVAASAGVDAPARRAA